MDRYLQRFRTWNFPDCSINTGSDQEKTFGPTISSLIHRHIGPERLLLWDSKKRGGRPDTMKILKEVYHYWNAEGTARIFSFVDLLAKRSSTVVFITSNYIGNSEIMEGCKEAGIPAFGTLWDFVRTFYPAAWYRLTLRDSNSDHYSIIHSECLTVYPRCTWMEGSGAVRTRPSSRTHRHTHIYIFNSAGGVRHNVILVHRNI